MGMAAGHPNLPPNLRMNPTISYSNINCVNGNGGIDQVARIPTKNTGDIDTNALSALLFVTETPLPTYGSSSSTDSASGSTTVGSSSSWASSAAPPSDSGGIHLDAGAIAGIVAG
jgi:hypothetical protein